MSSDWPGEPKTNWVAIISVGVTLLTAFACVIAYVVGIDQKQAGMVVSMAKIEETQGELAKELQRIKDDRTLEKQFGEVAVQMAVLSQKVEDLRKSVEKHH